MKILNDTIATSLERALFNLLWQQTYNQYTEAVYFRLEPNVRTKTRNQLYNQLYRTLDIQLHKPLELRLKTELNENTYF